MDVAKKQNGQGPRSRAAASFPPYAQACNRQKSIRPCPEGSSEAAAGQASVGIYLKGNFPPLKDRRERPCIRAPGETDSSSAMIASERLPEQANLAIYSLPPEQSPEVTCWRIQRRSNADCIPAQDSGAF